MLGTFSFSSQTLIVDVLSMNFRGISPMLSHRAYWKVDARSEVLLPVSLFASSVRT